MQYWRRNLNYNINEVFILRYIYFFYNLINKLFWKENQVPRTLCEARKVAGSAEVNKIKQYETVLPFKVSLFIKFIQSTKLCPVHILHL